MFSHNEWIRKMDDVGIGIKKDFSQDCDHDTRTFPRTAITIPSGACLERYENTSLL
jgi:hypothetical protein